MTLTASIFITLLITVFIGLFLGYSVSRTMLEKFFFHIVREIMDIAEMDEEDE